MKLARIALVTAAVLAAVAFAGVFQPSGAAADTPPGGLTVVGNASSTVTPDRAGFAFGTVSQGRTAAAALGASSEAVTKIIAALRRAGVARADIQTAEISISPRSSDNGDSIIGYTASNTVTAIVRKLDDAGDVIDAAVAAGANQVSGPNLLASDQTAAYNAALKAAVAEARAKAQTLATAAGVTLGRITTIAEGSGAPSPMQAGAVRESAVPIEPGTQEIQATVSVTFGLG
ncbi:MAG TPA: SIMPL domain-containing protein [Gaiellaceae bacterium]|nr:SIMPL domain-containing protein [Gaiellaceae bacterium]